MKNINKIAEQCDLFYKIADKSLKKNKKLKPKPVAQVQKPKPVVQKPKTYPTTPPPKSPLNNSKEFSYYELAGDLQDKRKREFWEGPKGKDSIALYVIDSGGKINLPGTSWNPLSKEFRKDLNCVIVWFISPEHLKNIKAPQNLIDKIDSVSKREQLVKQYLSEAGKDINDFIIKGETSFRNAIIPGEADAAKLYTNPVLIVNRSKVPQDSLDKI
jgi:hypothetical protein